MTAGRELAFPRPPVNYEAYEATRRQTRSGSESPKFRADDGSMLDLLRSSMLACKPFHRSLSTLIFSGLGCYRALDKRSGGDGETRVLPVPGKRRDEG